MSVNKQLEALKKQKRRKKASIENNFNLEVDSLSNVLSLNK